MIIYKFLGVPVIKAPYVTAFLIGGVTVVFFYFLVSRSFLKGPIPSMKQLR